MRILVWVTFFTFCQAVSSSQRQFLPPTSNVHPGIPPLPLFNTSSKRPPQATPTTSQPDDLFAIHTHPDGPLYAGDLVSFEIIAPKEADLEESQVQVQVSNSAPVNLGTADFNPYGIGGRLQATLTWVWDTRGLSAGEYPLNISILPDGPSWTETVSLLPREDLPPPEPWAKWETKRLIVARSLYYRHQSGPDLPSRWQAR
jgi:hypothetical protein